MKCPQCGKESGSTRFCTECGASFRKAQEKPVERSTVAVEVPAPVTTPEPDRLPDSQPDDVERPLVASMPVNDAPQDAPAPPETNAQEPPKPTMPPEPELAVPLPSFFSEPLQETPTPTTAPEPVPDPVEETLEPVALSSFPTPEDSVKEGEPISDPVPAFLKAPAETPAPVKAKEPIRPDVPTVKAEERPTGGKSKRGFVLVPVIAAALLAAWWQFGRGKPQAPASETPVVVKSGPSTPAVEPTPPVVPPTVAVTPETDIKTIAAAVLGYARSRDERLELVNASMPKLVAPYVGDEKIFSRDGSTYAFNDGLSGLRLDQVKEPEKTVLVYAGKDGQLDFKDGKAWVAFVNGDVRETATEDAAALVWKIAPDGASSKTTDIPAAPASSEAKPEAILAHDDAPVAVARQLRRLSLLPTLQREQSQAPIGQEEKTLAAAFWNLTPHQLWIAKNALYAFHGYAFHQSRDLRAYFNKAAWYRPTTVSAKVIDLKMPLLEKQNAWRLAHLVQTLRARKTPDSAAVGTQDKATVLVDLLDAPLPP